MSGIVSRLSVLGKVWLGLAAGAMALIIFCLAASGSSLFFPLVSLWCNAALFALALLVLRRAGVELDLFHKAVLWACGQRPCFTFTGPSAAALSSTTGTT